MTTSAIGRFIQSVTAQDVVYWGDLTPSGFTSFDYGLIEQVKVRWDDMVELAREEIGDETGSKAQLLVNKDMSVGGYVMLGTLGDEISVNTPSGMKVVKDGVEGTRHRYILVDGERIRDNEGEYITTEWHPKGLSDAYQIKKFSKVPEFKSTTNFVRMAYV